MAGRAGDQDSPRAAGQGSACERQAGRHHHEANRQVRMATRVPESAPRAVAAAGLVIGAVLGVAGTFAPSASVRGLAWGLDGTALVVATALLTIHHGRRGNDVLAAGYLLFVAGETLIL